MKFSLRDPMMVSAIVEGRENVTRELYSLFDFNSPVCVILRQDAVDIGYTDAQHRHVDLGRLRPENLTKFASMRGIENGIKVKLHKVSIGPLVAMDVDAVVLEGEHPRFILHDLVLGRTFLKNFKLTIDVNKGYLSLV